MVCLVLAADFNACFSYTNTAAPHKRRPNLHSINQLRHRVVDHAVVQFEQWGEYVGVELVHALGQVLVKLKGQQGLLLLLITSHRAFTSHWRDPQTIPDSPPHAAPVPWSHPETALSAFQPAHRRLPSQSAEHRRV